MTYWQFKTTGFYFKANKKPDNILLHNGDFKTEIN